MRELALRRTTGPDSTYPWPIPGAKRSRTIRDAEDRARMPVVQIPGEGPALCMMRLIALPNALTDRVEPLSLDLFTFYFREAVEMVAEAGCTLRNHVGRGEGSAVRHFDISLFDYMIVATGDPKTYIPLRQRLSDYIRDFTPLYGLRDQRVPKLCRLGVNQRGMNLVSHHQQDHVDLWKRFWPHRRPLNHDHYAFLRMPPDGAPVPDAFRAFEGVARDPFAVYVISTEQVMFLMTRSEEDLVLARLVGVI